MGYRRKSGRPSKLTEVLLVKIVERVKQGANLAAAARLEGVADSTLRDWRGKADADPASIFGHLFESAEGAELEVYEVATKGMVAIMKDPDPRVSGPMIRWWLERRRPAEFGTRAELRHAGPTGGPVQHEVSGPEGAPVPVAVAGAPRPARAPWSDDEVRNMTPEQLEERVRLALRLHDAGQAGAIDVLFTEAQLHSLSAEHLLALSRAARPEGT